MLTILYLSSLSQGLSLNLELDWWSASPRDALVPVPNIAGHMRVAAPRWVGFVWFSCCSLLFLRISYMYAVKYESGASLDHMRACL